ncbi:MAG: 1-deoxy-D-xylulose-5-phosphate synthase [Deltaproteobacteria bacterium]|nr:1-deoxy-D-xylulose-5-phosphate synthase [Deltaproteobacteria bacterium]
MSAATSTDERYELLDAINSPTDLRRLPESELPKLAEECRRFLIHAVAKTGGHLASSLGACELTIALHYVYETPEDRLVWDVGHQAYVHKLLTGRREMFPTLRQKGGMSGFPSRFESSYDTFGVGHGGTSISAAAGMNEGLHHQKKRRHTVAVIGDGSITSGMAFEALNHAGEVGRPFTVVLNDNEWAISRNVGALSRTLSRRIVTEDFIQTKDLVRRWVHEKLGAKMEDRIRHIEDAVKSVVLPVSPLFEAFGFEYLGPVDGHNVHALVKALRAAKENHKPVLLHILTRKGKGWEVSEADPLVYHGLGKYDPKSGERAPAAPAPDPWQKHFARAAIDLAKQDSRIVAITGAMATGTSCDVFQKEFPDRCYDVGMCEQHAVTLAAGLACEGMRPIAAIYSTFLQRAYDQVVHDVCIQNLPVLFCMDRAGLAGDDGVTHQGMFDIAYLRCLPNMVCMAPKDENELRNMMYTATKLDCPSSVRYPRGPAMGIPYDKEFSQIPVGKAEILREGKDVTLLALGHQVPEAVKAAELLAAEGVQTTVVNARFIKPLDRETIIETATATGRLVTIEEAALMGGFGSAVCELLMDEGVHRDIDIRRLGVSDRFVEHGTQAAWREEFKLTAPRIAETVRQMIRKTRLRSVKDAG